MTVRIRDRDPRFQHLETKVGVLVFVALVGILVLLGMVAKEKNLFTKKFNIYFFSSNGRGLNQGMPVKLAGFKVGRIKEIELAEGGQVKVTVEINRKYQKWLGRDTGARFVKEGFIGEPVIELSGTDVAAGLLDEGDVVPYEKTGGIEVLINEAKPVLKEIKEIIHYANSPEGDIKVSLGNIRELTTELKEAKRSLAETIKETGSLVRNANSVVSDVAARSGPLMDSTQRIIENVEAVTARLEPIVVRVDDITARTDEATKRLPEVAEKLEDVLDNVKTLTGELATQAPRIREIIADAEATAGDAKDVARAVKGSWPVRLMVPAPTEPGLIPLDGYLFERSTE